MNRFYIGILIKFLISCLALKIFKTVFLSYGVKIYWRKFGEFKYNTYLCTRNQNGSMDEWLSQRSAKPCTAVRIRLGPQEDCIKGCNLFCYNCVHIDF